LGIQQRFKKINFHLENGTPLDLACNILNLILECFQNIGTRSATKNQDANEIERVLNQTYEITKATDTWKILTPKKQCL